MVGALKDTREEARKANERGDRFEQEVLRLQAREAEVDSRITGEVESRVESRLAAAWDGFNRQIEELKGRVQ
ncbi:TIGR03752 family integrating conjugative element protein, partial [Mannheimia haemolytica]